MDNGWKLIFVVPNLQIKDPIEFDKFALVPSCDSRLVKIKEESLASKALLTKFSNQFDKVVHPCAIILNDKAPTFYRKIEVITDFRNAIAICAIIEGSSNSILRGQKFEPLFSDFFDFYPITPDKDGQHLTVHTPIVLDGYNDPDKFRGQVNPLTHTVFRTATIEDSTLDLLFRLWKKNPKKRSWKARAIFRSLQMAYQASEIFFSNHFSEFDIGSRIGLWVSAFEVLVHPGRSGKANLDAVLMLLGQRSFSKPELKQKRYRLGEKSINLIQKLYCQLYDSRNAFLHGNPIADKHIYPFGNKSIPHLLTVAPLIYKVALIEQLSKTGIKKKRRGRKSLAERIREEMDFEKVIIKYFNHR
ncbi:MAG: hypothetical protein P9L96_04285 [Candidatus Gygaella obscura]|nr:hypothetical protein [Candidatus Gygaella obscura]